MRQNYTKSNCSESWLNDGIVTQIVSPKIKKVNLDIAKQLISDRTFAMGNTENHAIIFVVVNNVISVDKETKKYYNTPEPYENVQAVAMLIDNYIARLVANLVFTTNKQPVPIEFFNNKEKAFKWLEPFKPLN